MTNILENLNDKQKQAVEEINRPCLVIAGAGSGKTKVLTHKIAYILENTDIKPYEILAITFTNKAANEMKERINTLISDKANDIWMGTFHSICVRILRRFIDRLGYEKSFLIFDTADQKTLIKTCLSELNIDEKLFTPKQIQSIISKNKNQMIDDKEYKKTTNGEYRKEKIAQIYSLYQEKLKINNSVDFDDLINLTIKLLENNEDVLEYYVNKFKYVLVDEYQDTNKSQFKLIKLLAKRNEITVVGDPEQGIYSFRRADISNILNFEKDFSNTKIIKLEQNYRCTQNILDVANAVIKHNPKSYEKTLWTNNEQGNKVKIYRAENEYEEAQYIVDNIENQKRNDDEKYKNFAVLYRTNTQSRVIEDFLRRDNIPYKIVGGLKFYERKEIKDCLAFLRLIENPWDNISLRRIINEPKRGIGKTTLDTIENLSKDHNISMYDVVKDADRFGYNKAYINTRILVDTIEYLKENKDNLSIFEILEKILDNSGYLAMLKSEKTPEADSRIDNIQELFTVIDEYEKEEADTSLAQFLENVTLSSDMDNLEDEDDSVTLMTLHSAKGLEFNNVFMVGLEEGLFPSIKSGDSEEKQVEEERRLCYVGITRAKKQLYMSFAKRRTTYARTVHNVYSRFLDELPVDKIDGYDYIKTAEIVVRGKPKDDLFKVDHNSFGRAVFKDKRQKIEFRTAEQFLSNLDKQKSAPVYQATNINDLKQGMQIFHNKFGNGIIKSIEPEGQDYKVDIQFEKVGHKRLMAQYANLKIII